MTQPATAPTSEPSTTAPSAPVAIEGGLPQDNSFQLPSLKEQVRIETERLKTEARKRGGAGAGGAAGRDESGRFKADQDEAQAAREDGEGKRRPAASKAREVDEDKAAELEARALETDGTGGEEDDPDAEAKADEPKPRGEPKAARWRIKLRQGEKRIEQQQAQLMAQSRANAEERRQLEADRKAHEARSARVGELEALEQALSSDPLEALYARKLDPETLVLRHYERIKNGGQPTPAQAAASAQLSPEVKKALERIDHLEKQLAEKEAKQTEAQQMAEVEKAKAHFLGQVTETEYPDLDTYRDLRGDEDVVASAFGKDGTAHWLEARLGRQPTHAEVLRQLNKDAGTWLAQRKVAKRFGERKTPDSDRVPEPRTAAEPEGQKPSSKTLSNRRVSSGTPAAPPDFGDRATSSRFLVDALARGRGRLFA